MKVKIQKIIQLLWINCNLKVICSIKGQILWIKHILVQMVQKGVKYFQGLIVMASLKRHFQLLAMVFNNKKLVLIKNKARKIYKIKNKKIKLI